MAETYKRSKCYAKQESFKKQVLTRFRLDLSEFGARFVDPQQHGVDDLLEPIASRFSSRASAPSLPLSTPLAVRVVTVSLPWPPQ